MPSPFPGMDPYLESPAHWSDFHSRFVNALSDSINTRLPENYVARIDERVMHVNSIVYPPQRSDYKPDVSVVYDPELPSRGTSSHAVALAEPVTLENIELLDPYTEVYLKIIRLPAHDLITVIELFSPTNKYGEGRGEYMQKRRELLHEPVHIVELDLLRAGPRLEFARPLPVADYFAFISRIENRNRSDAYGWSVRDPFPMIPVPLRNPDRDVVLDSSEPFAEAYDRGRYQVLIDYSKPPPPPAFPISDAKWVADIASGAAHGRPGAADH